MADSFFDNLIMMPDDDMTASVLADTNSLWNELNNHVWENYPNISCDWKYYGKSTGWLLKMISKKRNLFFFIPQDGYFRVLFIFGDKAVASIEGSELPNEIKETLRAAKRYASGRGIAVDIYLREQLDIIYHLLKIKYEN